LEDRGYEVLLGDCLDGARHVSGTAADRARELTEMLTDPQIRAVVPPWGGEIAIDLLPLLDWDAIRAAVPTWVIGFSDISTIITPLTLRTGLATIHGNNLMNMPYRTPDGLLSWLDIAEAPEGATLIQSPPGRYRSTGTVDFARNPGVAEYVLDAPGGWLRLDGAGGVDVQGRLIGGCIETLGPVVGSQYADPRSLNSAYADEGLLVYVEAAGDDAFAICRALHGMRLSGFFDSANAVLIGRTSAPARPSLTQHEAVLDALSPLGVPLIADVDCGHVAPFMPIVNGARGRLVFGGGCDRLEQTLD